MPGKSGTFPKATIVRVVREARLRAVRELNSYDAQFAFFLQNFLDKP
jgi:hypothetical protein